MLLSLQLYRELPLKIPILCIFHFVFKFRQFSVDNIILIIEMYRGTLITKGAFFVELKKERPFQVDRMFSCLLIGDEGSRRKASESGLTDSECLSNSYLLLTSR
jgi:hypothetical protein